MTCRDSIDHEARTREGITTYEHIVLCSLIGEPICYRRIPTTEFDRAPLEQTAPLDGLPDSQHNLLAIDRAGVSIIVFRGETPFAIEDPRTAAKRDGFNLSVRVGVDLRRTPATFDLHTISKRFFYLIRACRHLFTLLDAHHGNVLRPTSERHARGIHGHVAAAHDHDLVSNIAGIAHYIGLDSLTQERERSAHALCIFAFNTERSVPLRTDSQIERLESFIAQALERDILAHINTAADLHPQLT